MAMTGITLDTNEVLAIAARIESDNMQLKDLLEDSRQTVDGLASMWQGRASDDTRAAYNDFSNRYFQQYYDVLDQYVKFLRRNVAEAYEETEQVNVQLADAFR